VSHYRRDRVHLRKVGSVSAVICLEIVQLSRVLHNIIPCELPSTHKTAAPPTKCARCGTRPLDHRTGSKETRNPRTTRHHLSRGSQSRGPELILGLARRENGLRQHSWPQIPSNQTARGYCLSTNGYSSGGGLMDFGTIYHRFHWRRPVARVTKTRAGREAGKGVSERLLPGVSDHLIDCFDGR